LAGSVQLAQVIFLEFEFQNTKILLQLGNGPGAEDGNDSCLILLLMDPADSHLCLGSTQFCIDVAKRRYDVSDTFANVMVVIPPRLVAVTAVFPSQDATSEHAPRSDGQCARTSRR
jgi:hypothetical protein